MSAFFVALAAAIVPAESAAQPANGDVTHVFADGWQSSDFHGSNPGCSMGGNAAAPGGRLIMGSSLRKPTPMNLVLKKAGWAIPAGTQIKVRAVFPDGYSTDLSGTGNGNSINVELSNDAVAPWVHHLTANPSLQMQFGGNEPPWNFDLTGTTKVVNAMGDCFHEHAITAVAAPFSGASALQADGGAATQPFGGSLQPNNDNQQPASRPASANICRTPDMAKEIMAGFDDFDAAKQNHVRAIDIEHMITIRADPTAGIIICHGTFVLTNGLKLTGTYTIKPNVAGDLINSWTMDPGGMQ